jgi:hypothetical protein
MRTLISIIGKAPSEIPFEELLGRIHKERERVLHNVENFRAFHTAVKKTPKGKATKVSRDLKAAMEALGLTLADIEQLKGGKNEC